MRSRGPAAPALVVALVVGGCAPRLYLTESDVAALGANLRDAATADALFEPLEGEMLDLRLVTRGGSRFEIVGSNTLELLRSIGRLAFIEALGQLSLPRLSDQLDDQLGDWIDAQRALVARSSGSRIEFTRLDRFTLRLEKAPRFVYDAASQTVDIDLHVRPTLHGRLHHRIVGDDLLGSVSGFLIDLAQGSGTAEGDNDVVITVPDLRLRARIRLAAGRPDAAEIELRLRPAVVPHATDPGAMRRLGYDPSGVGVSTSAPSRVREALAGAVRDAFSRTVYKRHVLRFERFTVPRLRLEDDGGTTRLVTSYRSLVEPAIARLDVVARRQDGGLVHLRREGDASAPQAALPGGPFASDPALVASAPGVLEVVAVATDGELVHLRRLDGAWRRDFGSFDDRALDAYTADRPALLATAQGELEVMAVEAAGLLTHLRRRRGVWRPPAVILDPALPSPTPSRRPRDPATLQVGRKLLLVYRDPDDDVRGRVFDLETEVWGQSFVVLGGVAGGPTLAPLGDGFVGVAARRPDGTVAFCRLYVQAPLLHPPGGTWGVSVSLEVSLAGNLGGEPRLVAFGPGRLLLAGPGADGRLESRWFDRDRWGAWRSTDDRFFGTTVVDARIAPELSVAADRQGEVHVLARVSSNGPGRLLLDRHPGPVAETGAATSPWRWRGWQELAAERFVGRPAVALGERLLPLAVVGQGLRLWTAEIGDVGPATLQRHDGSRVRFPGDPVVLTSQPGRTDVLFAADDGTLRDVTRDPAYGTVEQAFGSGGADYGGLAAVAVGGEIDLVALRADHSLDYWRRQRGEWEGPVRLGTGVLSLPSLVHLGAGDLDLLAVGDDLRLRRWRYRGGAWTAATSLAVTGDASAVLFGPGSVSVPGAGTIDVVVAGAGTRELLHTRFRADRTLPAHPLVPAALGPWAPLGIATADRPVLTSFGPRRAHLVVPRGDGGTMGGWLAPTATGAARRAVLVRGVPVVVPVTALGGVEARWSSFRPITLGYVSAAARLGDGELAVAFGDRSGGMHLRLFRQGRWLPDRLLEQALAPLAPGVPLRPVLATPER